MVNNSLFHFLIISLNYFIISFFLCFIDSPYTNNNNKNNNKGDIMGDNNNRNNKKTRVIKKNRKIQPNLIEVGCEVSIPSSLISNHNQNNNNDNNNNHNNQKEDTITYRTGKVISISDESQLCDIELTDSEGGIVKGIPPESIYFTNKFNFQET